MRILLVEDNPHDEVLVRRALKKKGVKAELVVARDGVEALDFPHGTGEHAGRDTNDQRSLVLLDLKLSLVNGLEVLKRMRADQRTQLLPVVLLTTSDEERDRIAGYSLGADSYVRKPIEHSEFTEAIRRGRRPICPHPSTVEDQPDVHGDQQSQTASSRGLGGR